MEDTNKTWKRLIRIQKDKSRLVLIVMLILFHLSMVMLITNRGFYYTFYQHTYQLEFSGDINLDQFSSRSYVSGLDRTNKIVRLQNIPSEELNKLTNDLEEGAYTLTEVDEYLPQNFSEKLMLGLLAVLLIIPGIIAFNIYRNISASHRNSLIRFCILLGTTALLTLFITVGLLSLISRVYELTYLSLAVVFVAGLFVAVTSYYYLYRTFVYDFSAPTIELSLATLSNHVARLAREDMGKVIGISIVVIALLIAGLGVTSLLDLTILFLSIIIWQANLVVLPKGLLSLLRRIKRIRSKRRSEIKKEERVEEKNMRTTSKPKKSKKNRRR